MIFLIGKNTKFSLSWWNLLRQENDDYRTENENEVFRIFRRFTAVCKGGKEKRQAIFTACRLLSE